MQLFLSRLAGPDFPVIGRLLGERWRKLAPRYALAMAFMTVTAGATAGAAYLMKDLINKVFLDKDPYFIGVIAGAIVVLYTAKGMASYAQEVILSRVGNRIIADTQRRMYDKLLALDLGFYQSRSSGDLVTWFTYNAQATRDVLNLIVTSIGRDLFTLVGLVIVMVVQDPLMSAMALVVGPIVVLVLTGILKRMRKLFRRGVDSISAVVSTMQETAQGVRVIRAFGLEDAMRARMEQAITSVEKINNRMAAVSAQSNPLVDTLGGFAVAAIVVYGGWRVMNGATPGEFFSFITALLMATEPARRLSRVNITLAGAATGVRIMYELIDAVPEVRDAPDARPLAAGPGRIALENVSFGYNERGAALDGATLDVAAGSTTALVGISGSGKSSVLNLIMRFWDPQAGRVTIDGQDLRGVTLASLRRRIALVSQDTFLFTGTIRDNIMQGRAGASEAEMIAAAKAAHAHDFISAMPQGYDTQIGEAGSQLSGGQRQRVSIARAFLKDAEIILLDEPTSALDSESDAAIQQALVTLTKGRTTVVIAHRLSTVTNADRIYVMDAGRVIETGSHEELIARAGSYARLHALQFGGEIAEGPEPAAEPGL
jgi:ATP-binding cassette subfamily B protein